MYIEKGREKGRHRQSLRDLYMYIYIERERERESARGAVVCLHLLVCCLTMHLSMCLYIKKVDRKVLKI